MKRSSDIAYPKYPSKQRNIMIQENLNHSIDSSNYNISNLKCDYFPTIKSTKSGNKNDENVIVRMSDYFEKGPTVGSVLPQFTNYNQNSSRYSPLFYSKLSILTVRIEIKSRL